MALVDLFQRELIDLDLTTVNKQTTMQHMANRLYQNGDLSNLEQFVDKLLAREELSTTGVGDEIAIPHAQDETIKEARIIFARSEQGIDWQALDQKPVKMIFMIAAPTAGNNEHLRALAKLSTVLMKDEAKEAFLKAKSPEEVLAVVRCFDPDQTQRAVSEGVSSDKGEVAINEDTPYILAVTACPTGIAHTYMAEEKLKQAAIAKGIRIKVETNGQSGVNNRLSAQDIAQADAIIIAADRNVEMTRFNGKPVLIRKVSDGINKASELMDLALSGEIKTYQASAAEAYVKDQVENESLGRKAYKHLMNGVSHMLPFVVAGGLLIALSFFWGINSADPADPSFNVIAHFLKTSGAMAFALMLPVLAGFIGRSLADTPGLVIGMMGGVFANPNILSAFAPAGLLENMSASGFLGALVAGFLAGGIVWLLRKVFSWLPKSLEGMKPILIYPVLGVMLMAIIMLLVINAPLGAFSQALTNGLKNMSNELGVLVGFVAGAMMSIDMGGPINKAAYVTGTALVTEAAGAGSDIMAAVMVGGMVPPLAIALASTLKPKLWPSSQRNSALVNYVMGAAFITEGAIPFAAANPLRVIPSLAIGAGVAGALSMLFKCVSYVPHGGIFAVVAQGVSHPLMFLLSWLIGGLVGAFLLIFLLRGTKKDKI